MGESKADDIMVLDESGANLAMTRRYGRAASNQRLHWPSPYARGSHYSIIAAISPHKIVTRAKTAEDFQSAISAAFHSI